MALVPCSCVWHLTSTNHGNNVPLKLELVDPNCPAPHTGIDRETEEVDYPRASEK